MRDRCYFPFGQELRKVEQIDRSPKETFILGVYASAVHAKWVGKDGKQKVKALVVASEPEIFWRGENADKIISKIGIPSELGVLTVPTDKNLNGPSGKALDEKYLKPLGLYREQVWLCDLLPESRLNKNQKSAIEKHYTEEIIKEFNLKSSTIPLFKKGELGTEQRQLEVLNELRESKAERIIILGDVPILYFLKTFNGEYDKLLDFGKTEQEYGKEHDLKISGKTYKVLPLCHPRQSARLGDSTKEWGILHDSWLRNR